MRQLGEGAGMETTVVIPLQRFAFAYGGEALPVLHSLRATGE